MPSHYFIVVFFIVHVRDHEVEYLYTDLTLSSLKILFRNAQIDVLLHIIYLFKLAEPLII